MAAPALKVGFIGSGKWPQPLPKDSFREMPSRRASTFWPAALPLTATCWMASGPWAARLCTTIKNSWTTPTSSSYIILLWGSESTSQSLTQLIGRSSTNWTPTDSLWITSRLSLICLYVIIHHSSESKLQVERRKYISVIFSTTCVLRVLYFLRKELSY